jgi:hypothetical protein
MAACLDNRIFIWVIDAADHLISVNEAWLAFARENGAPSLSREAVLMQPLRNFIADRETWHLTNIILTNIRAGKSCAPLLFRCDSPGCRRFLEMELALLPQAAVEFRSRVIKEEPRSRFGLLDPEIDRSGAFLRICSWCKRIYLEGSGWVEAEVAVKALNLFDGGRMPALTHGICETCLAEVQQKFS